MKVRIGLKVSRASLRSGPAAKHYTREWQECLLIRVRDAGRGGHNCFYMARTIFIYAHMHRIPYMTLYTNVFSLEAPYIHCVFVNMLTASPSCKFPCGPSRPFWLHEHAVAAPCA